MNLNEFVITEELIEEIEQLTGVVHYPHTFLQVFTINKNNDKVLLKASSPEAQYDNKAALLMRHFFELNDAIAEKDGRNIVISSEDFYRIFLTDTPIVQVTL